MESTGRDTPQTRRNVPSMVDLPELSQEDVTLYRRITGILMYLATDRPDVLFTVNELTSAMSKPTKAALEALKHLTRYLLKTKDYEFTFHLIGMVLMTCCSHRQRLGRRQSNKKIPKCSPSGMWRMLGVFLHQRQAVVALLSAEAELYATVSGVSEAILFEEGVDIFWIRGGPPSHHRQFGKQCHQSPSRSGQDTPLWLQDLVYDAASYELD
eukprot:s3084_g7.t1